MGEMRRFIKSNNIIMRLTSLVLTVALLASAFVYFGDEKMNNVSAGGSAGGQGTTKSYMKYVVERLIDGVQEEFTILEIVPYKGQGEFGYYASDDDIELGLEADQEYLETLYRNTGKTKNADGSWTGQDQWVKVNSEYSNFNYEVRYNSSLGRFEAKGPDTFTDYVVHEYGDLVSEKINVNTVEANNLTEADINNADLIIISTGTHDNNTVAAYRKYSGDMEELVYKKKDDGSYEKIADNGQISYRDFEKILKSEVPEEDVPEEETPVVTSGKVYFKNSDNWGDVYIYFWSSSNDNMTQWPGEKMSLVEGEDKVYEFEISSDVENIIFTNNRSSKTNTLSFSGFEKAYVSGRWVDYPIVEEEIESESSTEETTTQEGETSTQEGETSTQEGETSTQEGETTTQEETTTEQPTTPPSTTEPGITEPGVTPPPAEEEDPYTYISRDMSWAMCEKLLDYIIVGKDIELPSGSTVTNVRTPVVIDNGGISNLDKDSNMYKMLLIYRMCDTDRWQELKNHIVKTDETGAKIKSDAGVATIAANVGGTLITDWAVGNDNTLKAVFDSIGNKTAEGTQLSAYRETEPFNPNYLTNDYWVYNGDSWIIPTNVNGTVTTAGNEEVTKAFKDRLGTGNTKKAVDILRYILGATEVIRFSDPVRVLEIQPCNCFLYNTSTKKQELADKLLRTDASKVTVDCVTPNALNGMTVDIASKYDLVIIGDNIGSSTDTNRLMQSNGKTIYNDRALNGYIYLAFGDLIKVSTYALGYLPDEYLQVNSTSGLRPVNNNNKHVWTKYLFAELTADKYYVVHDMRNYYVTQKKVKKLAGSTTVIDNESFYLDHKLGNTRISDNDITDITREKLEEYVKTGNPIVVAESIYTADRTKIYPTSDMYKFATETLGATDSTGKRINTNVLKTETIGSAIAYLGTRAPRIKFVQGEVSYIKRTGNKTWAYNEDNEQWEQVDEYITESATLDIKPVTPTYSNYTYKNSNGSTEQISGVVNRFNGRQLLYKFNITGQVGKTYLVKLLVDKNNDGVFNDVKSGVADDDNEVYYSKKVKLNARTQQHKIETSLADNFIGMCAWRIDVIELNPDDTESVYRVSATDYSAIRNEDKRPLKVLQIAPYDGSHLDLNEGNFKKYMEAVEGILGYDMEVSFISIDGDEGFISKFTDSPYVKGNIDVEGMDRLKGYDMVVLGFADSYGGKDINNDYGALDNILDFMDAGKAVLFTHDTVSWRSTPNYKAGYKSGTTETILSPGSIYDVKSDGNTGSQTQYGNTCFNLTINFRNRVGMDRYGVTLEKDYDPNTEENPRKDKEVPKYGVGCIIPSYMATDSNSVKKKDAITGKEYYVATQEIEVRELQGFNNWNTARMNFCFYVCSSYKTDKGYYWLAPYGENGYDNSDTGSVMYKTSRVVQLNEGPITKYPYNVGTSVDIAETHGQYFELDMEDEDIVVWYTLDAGSAYYTRTYKDAGNNFYIYSKNNITYSGAGHSSIGATQELKLFVNTIVKAIAGGNAKPDITVTNGAEVSGESNQYIVYVNSSDSAANYEIDFMALDPDLVAPETVGNDMSLVGEFSSAKVYWQKPATATTEAQSILIKEYGAVNENGQVVTDPLKNGIIQELLLGNTSLGEADLNAIADAVRGRSGASFMIEVSDAKGMKDTVFVQLQARDLFDMD